MKRLLIILLLVTCGLAREAAAQVAIVTHSSVDVSELDTQKLIDIFVLETKRWSDGDRITPVELKGKSDIKTTFYDYIGRSASEIKRERLRIILAGDGDPPVPAKSTEDALQKISTTPGAIGYLPLQLASNGEVNVIHVIHN
ncbi:MAG: hypothetical protein KTR29_15560 [Rhodothermaceae bacterium]|nr:hypothetical protein [Rhodothermaceae bacterium]